MAMPGSATDAYAKVLKLYAMAEGDVIVTSENDYSSNHVSHFLALEETLWGWNNSFFKCCY